MFGHPWPLRALLALALCGLLACEDRGTNAAQEPPPLPTAAPDDSLDARLALETRPPLPADLHGTWRNRWTRISLTSTAAEPKVDLDVKDDQWADRLGLMPVCTTFHQDGRLTYTLRQAPDGLLLHQGRARWRLKEDTLTLSETVAGSRTTTRYHLRWQEGTLLMQGTLDWDRDGRRNDAIKAVLTPTTEADSCAS